MLSISVVIPAYNTQKWIGRAIESVLNQTVRPAEILVVDDGSIDATAEAVRKYEAEVRYFHQENSGPAVARNRGIDEAKSEWIAFLDADDEWLPHKIESQLSVLEENPELKWCSCAHEDVDNGKTIPHLLPENLNENAICLGELSFFSAILEGVTFGTPSFVIHRSVFDDLGRFDPEMLSGQDTDMWCRIALKYPRIGYCFKPCWRYHCDNPNSITRNTGRSLDLHLKSFCRNMLHAKELGREVADDFRLYARKKVVDYLILAAGTKCFVGHDTLKETKSLFPLTVRDRAILKTLKLLPKAIASKAAIKLWT